MGRKANPVIIGAFVVGAVVLAVAGIIIFGSGRLFADTTPFVMWPGADTLPRFESGHLMRLDLPASVAISLGLTLPGSGADVVRADILIGQDGLARAVRVAP